MEYPTITATPKSKQNVDSFNGYNHNLRIAENEFFDMKNMTSDYYPVLSPRGKRGVYASPAHPTGLIAKDALCYVDGTNFVINEYSVDMGLNGDDKQLISMGAYVIIMPDKKWINTITHEHGDIEAHVTTANTVTFDLCTLTGDIYNNPEISADEPKEPENLDLWIDTSSTPHTLKQYSASSATWVAIPTTYIKITCAGSDIGEIFKQYDGVTISGVTSLPDLNSATTIWSCGGDSIVVPGILDESITQTTPICISRWMPKLDLMTECNNRLWGCFYGIPYKGKAYDVVEGVTKDVYGTEVVNEIYSCKLGVFKNWYSFMGLSTDSYAVSVGTDGQWTGAVTHSGYPCFFKEDFLHKVYGDYPSNYRVQDTACRGVQKGCERSLAIVNEVLYYKSRNGVCSYDGSLPVDVSSQFGYVYYNSARGGAHGNKYYISMRAFAKWNLFVYDTLKGMWHKEDDLEVDHFCSCDDELYAISGGEIITMFGSGTQDTNPVEWMAETGEIGLSSPDTKYISRLNVRMAMEIGSSVEMFIQYDMSESWERICTLTCTSLRSFSIPIMPRRCDHMRLKIVGTGDVKIYGITKTIAEGSGLA